MPPILTDAAREFIVAVCDERVAAAKEARYNFETISDNVSAARCLVEEYAFRVVAEVLCKERIVENATSQ